MCTAITYQTADHYFGRNLDYDYPFPCSVIITPKAYSFSFSHEKAQNKHFAIIGMGMVQDGYPLYYDAMNEHGLSIAGLNFPGNATYLPCSDTKSNIAPYELIPWILGQCSNLNEAKELLNMLNIIDKPFRTDIPLSPLHWIVADKTDAVTVEPTARGLKIYKNPVGVLTNNPPFPYHLDNLCNYLNVSALEAHNRFSADLSLTAYSRGMGGWGLPGDMSSASRFVRASFTKWNSPKTGTEKQSITQFFHILDSVTQVDGCVQVNDRYEKTLYSSCCSQDKGVYYYTTYENRQITAVSMYDYELQGDSLVCYPIRQEQQILFEK